MLIQVVLLLPTPRSLLRIGRIRECLDKGMDGYEPLGDINAYYPYSVHLADRRSLPLRNREIKPI